MHSKGNNLKHLDEQTLALYVLKAPEVDGKRGAIAAHLRDCEGCAIMYENVSGYYEEFHAIREKDRSANLARETTARALQRFVAADSVTVSSAQTLQQRFAASFRQYPARWSIGFVAALASVVLFIGKFTAGDTNPGYARAKDEFLVVYNKKGDELWRKHVGIGFDAEEISKGFPSEALENFLTVVDVDNDGTNEVIAVFGSVRKPLVARRNNVVCYHSDGNERWKYTFTRRMKFGNEEFSDSYNFINMVVDDFNGDGSVEVLGKAVHSTYYPGVLVRLDAAKGVLLDEYWHSGVITPSQQVDIDKDGIRELIWGGTNNGYNQAAVLVLDPRRMGGYAPAPVAYTPAGVRPGQEKYYLLLPRTDVNMAGAEKRNGVLLIRSTTDSLLEIRTIESQAIDPMPGVYYYFDSEMRCVRVIGNDYFEETHRKLEAEGKIRRKLDEGYYEELRNGVRYWDGEKFVKEPVKNRKYREIAAK